MIYLTIAMMILILWIVFVAADDNGNDILCGLMVTLIVFLVLIMPFAVPYYKVWVKNIEGQCTQGDKE